MQYTLRDVPAAVDRALRRRARQEGRSLNQVALDALARGAGVADTPVKQRDLSSIAGTWVEDPLFDAVIEEQERVDPSLWPSLRPSLGPEARSASSPAGPAGPAGRAPRARPRRRRS